MNQFPPSPRVSPYDCFKFFQKFAEIFASQGAPPVSTSVLTTLAAKLPPVSTTPSENLPPVSTTPAAYFATSFTSVDTICHWCGKQWEQYQTADTLKVVTNEK
jgi:hypothetical protein